MKFMVVIDVEPDAPAEANDGILLGERLQRALANSTACEALQDAVRGTVTMELAGQFFPADSEIGRRVVAEQTIRGLQQFAEQLESGVPIPVKILTQEQTPDGPLTTITDGMLDPKNPENRDPGESPL